MICSFSKFTSLLFAGDEHFCNLQPRYRRSTAQCYDTDPRVGQLFLNCSNLNILFLNTIFFNF